MTPPAWIDPHSFWLPTVLAFALDAALGDPRSWPHPVKAVAAWAGWLERRTRAVFARARVAGAVTALGVYLAAGGVAFGAWWGARALHPWAGCAVAAWLVYTTVAARDLARHARAVAVPLENGDLPEARRAVGMIVGRDTAALDEEGVSRAAVESVAESLADGVISPLFWAFVAGPVGAMVYRAVNTLDSMFGHQDEQYREFGGCSARVDDAANWIPARLAAVALCAAVVLRKGPRRARAAAATWFRDGARHASPNAGRPEAAMAGALGVALGGVRHYDGEAHDAPVMGRAEKPCDAGTIREAIRLMAVASLLFLAVSAAISVMVSISLSGSTP